MTLRFTHQDALYWPDMAQTAHEEGLQHGHIELPLNAAEASEAREILEAGAFDRLLQGGKSTFGQAFLDSEIDLTQAHVSNGVLQAPARLLNYSSHDWLSIARKTRIDLGKIGLLSPDHKPLDAQGVLEGMNRRLIGLSPSFKKATKRANGQVELPVVPGIEWVLPEHLTEEQMLMIASEGRIGIRRIQAIKPRKNIETHLAPGESFVGGIRLSLVGYTAMVGDAVNQCVKHYEARRLDGDRTTGTVGYTDPTKLVHVELRNEGSEPVAKSKLRVPVTFHETGELSPVRRLYPGWSNRHQYRVLREGVGLGDMLRFDPTMIEALIEPLFAEDCHSFLIRKSGLKKVPMQDAYDWQKDAEVQALKAEIDEALEGPFAMLQSALSSTHEQGAIMVTRDLGSISHLENLYRGGVRHVLFEGMNMTRSHHEGELGDGPRGNMYLSAEKHKKLLDLASKGMKFYWFPKTNGTKGAPNGVRQLPREFYRGGFVLMDEPSKDLVEKVTYEGMGVAMFGSSVDESDDNPLADQIDQFVQKVALKAGGSLSVFHGNGPSIMAMADRAAHNNSVMSGGIGMNFEQVGEAPNFAPHYLLLFEDDEIEYRQTYFEQLKTVPIFNLGGKGTLFELALSFLKSGLKTSLPVPIVMVDPTGGDFWKGFVEQVQTMTQQEFLGYKFKRPLTQTWTANVFKPVENYEAAAQVVCNFLEDPSLFWREIGISEAELDVAFRNQLALYQKTGLGIPRFLRPSFKARGLKIAH